MKRVLKWDVPVDGRGHKIGAGKVVHVGCQDVHYTLQVWTEEVPGEVLTDRVAWAFGTGHEIPDHLEHLGSVVVAHGALVWHVYYEGGDGA